MSCWLEERAEEFRHGRGNNGAKECQDGCRHVRKNDARLNLGPLVAAVPPSSASTVRVRTGLRGVREFSSELGVGGLSSESGVRYDREVTLRLSIEVERPTGFFKSFKVIVDGSLGKRFLLWDGVDARLYKGTTQCA